jgi:DNA polymerase III alpha subunit
MQVLHAVGKVPLRDAYAVVKAISKKKIEKFGKYKEIFISNAQMILDISEEESHEFWGQIEEFSKYGFNKSHSCAYTHQSSRQLWLKAHYPLEFYCTMLNHVREDDKLRDCKRNAESHGVKVNPLNVNKSCMNFCIPPGVDEIYFGFSNIKSVGEDVGAKIVALRDEGDFLSFQDFLDRFGTDSRVVQALVSLGAFDDASPLTMWQYYEFYKGHAKKRQERMKRFSAAMIRYQEQYDELVGDGRVISEEVIGSAIECANDSDAAKKLRRLMGNYRRSITRFQENSIADQNITSLSEFAESPVDVHIKDKVYDTLIDKEKAEMQFYGFCWRNPLDGCKEAEGHTFERIKDVEQNRDIGHSVEGLVQEVRDKTSAKGNKFRVLKLVDANWEVGYIYVWAEEKERFKEEFQDGNIVRLRVLTPSAKFGQHQLLSFPPYLKRKVPPIESDFRVAVLHHDVPESPSELVTVEKDESPITLNMLKKTQSGLRRDDAEQDTSEFYRELSAYFDG